MESFKSANTKADVEKRLEPRKKCSKSPHARGKDRIKKNIDKPQG